MARMAGATWVGPHHDNGRMNRYDIVCLHTIVGNPPAHAAHFSTRGDGLIYQSRDTAYQAAANYEGNPRIIAIENDDTGPEFGAWNTKDSNAVPFFTAAQIEANAEICAWANQVHGIPLIACPDSRPTSRGVAYHRQGIDGNWAGFRYGGRVAGGETWTLYRGKGCPGDRRISQIPTIITRARQIAGLERAADPIRPPLNLPEDLMKTWYLQGDVMPHVFCVSVDGDRVVRRHVSPQEWAIVRACGETVHRCPQADIDFIPWGATPGTNPWTKE